MDRPPNDPVDELDARWAESRAGWERALGRLRLDAEPLDEQVARHRAVCRTLTAVTSAIAAVFVALFAAFDRPLVGLAFAALFWIPIVGAAWWGQSRMAGSARAFDEAYRAYLEERRELESE